ncbi:hypothetical protein [Macrococcus brunensis]|uniref:hypothetical protein n=1 Tax=Macrococcus brunensis TaxID=198483 RepID=UPI001EF0B00D|nr:hypothetical protein [Macrococcus brunensis]ULG71090.1 hypothetical protein MGG12_06945 [Macrococcus brunensis]ULG73426.1 hypothetical protein MGG13_06805 [Macrococcus brunensis]
MKASKAFLLIDAMLSLAITSLICMMLLPMLQNMSQHYRDSYTELQTYRQVLIEVRRGEGIYEHNNKLCTENHCISKR